MWQGTLLYMLHAWTCAVRLCIAVFLWARRASRCTMSLTSVHHYRYPASSDREMFAAFCDNVTFDISADVLVQVKTMSHCTDGIGVSVPTRTVKLALRFVYSLCQPHGGLTRATVGRHQGLFVDAACSCIAARVQHLLGHVGVAALGL